MKEETEKELKRRLRRVFSFEDNDETVNSLFSALPDELTYLTQYVIDSHSSEKMKMDEDKRKKYFFDNAMIMPKHFGLAYNNGVVSEEVLEKRRKKLEKSDTLLKQNGLVDMENFWTKEDFSLIYIVGLKHRFTVDDYLNNKAIQYYLKYFELDVGLFWYFLLFAYDCTYEACIDGVEAVKSNVQIMKEFLQMIDSNVQRPDYTKKKEEQEIKNLLLTKDYMSLTLKVGKKKLVIKRPAIIEFIRWLCDVHNERLYEHPLISYMDLSVLIQRGKTESEGPRVAYFARAFIGLFDSFEQIVKKRKRKKSTSPEEYDFIAKLAYFTKLTGDSVYRENGVEALKKAIGRHRKYKYTNFSRYFDRVNFNLKNYRMI